MRQRRRGKRDGCGLGDRVGGKYFCPAVPVTRPPRHGASLPVAVAISCSADRQCLGKITPEGVFIEQLEFEPGHYLPEPTAEQLAGDDAATDDVVRIDLSRPCLLYTSPSPRDRTRYRMPSSA